MTLPPAAAAGNGALIGLQNLNGDNTISVNTSGGDILLNNGVVGATGQFAGQSVLLISDGTSQWAAVAANNTLPSVTDIGVEVIIKDGTALFVGSGGFQVSNGGNLDVDAPGTAFIGGPLQARGQVQLLGGATFGTITPPALAAASINDNYSPANLGVCNRIRQDLAGNASLGGLDITAFPNAIPLGVDGTLVTIVNISAFTLTVLHASPGSLPDDSFALPGSVNLAIPPNGAKTFEYDGVSAVWRVFA